MSSNVVNQAPFLRTSRDFPEDDTHNLVMELSKAYIDTASAINDRIIGIFPTNKPSVTGESWFFDKNKKQQTLRQAYFFTTTAPITHGINVSRVSAFSRCFGQYTDGTNWYGIINGTSVAIAGQLVFYVSPTQIVFVTGGGTMPAISKGNIVLEWISQT